MKKTIAATALLLLSLHAVAEVNIDSLRLQLDNIQVTQPSARNDIDKLRKNALKGDLKSISQLGVECMSGTNVKADLNTGLNLLETAANEGLADAQYNLGNYYFIFWARNPERQQYFNTSSRWLRRALRTEPETRTYSLMGRLFFEYGRYSRDTGLLTQSAMFLKNIPDIDIVSNKDESIVSAQALLGNVCLGQWRLDGDTAALREAKKWYRLALRSEKECPNYSNYIDSLAFVLSQGVPMSIDPPVPAEEQTGQAGPNGGRGGRQGGGMGGFPSGMGGFPGMGGSQGGFPAQRGPVANYPGGMMQMMQFIRANTTYPKACEDARIKGQAIVQFTIGTDGAVINPRLVNESEINHLLGREALRTVMMMPDWTPARTDDGTAVEYQTQTTISFGNSNGGGMGGFGGGFF